MDPNVKCSDKQSAMPLDRGGFSSTSYWNQHIHRECEMPQQTMQPDGRDRVQLRRQWGDRMNTLQKDIYSVICSIVKINDFDRMYKDNTIRYGLLNYIAKYSLARDSYFTTEASLNYLLANGYIHNGRLRRGLKSQKNGFTYEHPVPCNVIGVEIARSRNNAEKIAKILDWSDKVTVLTAEENEKFRLLKLLKDAWGMEIFH